MHNYNTRSSQKLHLFNTRTTYGQRCIKYKGSSLWDNLPMSLRLCSSITVFGYTSCLCMCVCLSVWVPVMFYFRCFSFFANTCQRLNYFVCARPIGGQHDGHLPFWLPSFVKFIMLKLYVCVCIAEINILLHWTLNPFNKCADLNLPDFMQWLQNSFRSHSHSFFVNTSCQRLLLRLCYRWPA